MKKLIAILAVLALILAACDAGGGGDEDTTPTTAATDDDGGGGDDGGGDDGGGDDGGDTGAQTGGSLLEEVIARGTLNCGVNETLPGFGSKDEAGAFVEVQADFPERLVAHPRVDLVRRLVAPAQVCRRADGIAKRAVITGGVLGGVSEDPRVTMARALQGCPDLA